MSSTCAAERAGGVFRQQDGSYADSTGGWSHDSGSTTFARPFHPVRSRKAGTVSRPSDEAPYQHFCGLQSRPEFELDLHTGELRVDGHHIVLQEKPFQVLKAKP
jgi:hypothetical protein